MAKVGPSRDFRPCPRADQWRDAKYMQPFWRRDRSPKRDCRERHDHPAGANRDGTARLSSRDASREGLCFDYKDWEGIKDLLASGEPGLVCTSGQQTSGRISASLASLRSSLGSEILPAGPMTDTLLDVWTVVHESDPAAARPVECLLSSLVGRDLVSAREVEEMCNQVEVVMKAGPDPAAEVVGGPGATPSGAETAGRRVFKDKRAR